MLRNTLNTFITATLIMLLGVSSSAKAVLPTGNLMGTTTVTFGEGDPESPRKIEVIVTLVPSAPSVSIVRDAVEALEPDTAVELTVTITSTANGLDNYVVTAETVGSDGLVDVGAFTLSELVGQIPLGATAAISIDGRIITVLYDGQADNGNVNGIEVKDIVVIGDNEYEVASISDKEESSTITLTNAGDAPDIKLGTHIVERKTELVKIESIASLQEGADWEDLQVTYIVSAASTSATGPGGPEETLIVDVLEEERAPAYDKWVRNVTPERNPDEDGAADNLEELWGVTDEGILDKDWHQAGVTALPDDTLEYLVVVRAGNRADLVNWSVEESAPDFTEIVEDSGRWFMGKDFSEPRAEFINGSFRIPNVQEYEDSLPRNDSFYLTYQVKVIGGVGGEVVCDGSNPDLFNWEKCKGDVWDARNGTTLEKNPVCWKKGVEWNPAESPWVVGRAARANDAGYDCRTKCAQGREFKWCAQRNWWEEPAAKTTYCTGRTGNAEFRDKVVDGLSMSEIHYAGGDWEGEGIYGELGGAEVCLN